MADGVIKASDVLIGVKEEVAATVAQINGLNTAFIKLQSTIKKANTTSQANVIARETNRLTKEQTQAIINLERVKKQEATTAAAVVRQKQAEAIAQEKITREKLKTQRATESELKRQQRLTNFYSQQSLKLRNLRNEYKALLLKKQQNINITKAEERRISSLGRQIRILDTQLKSVDASAGQFGRSVGNYKSAFGGLVASFSSIAKGLGVVAVIQGLTTAFSNAARTITEFDQSQADLAAILGTTKDEIATLTEQALFLGRTTAFTATEVANLQLELSKLGFNSGEILAATQGVENLALATGVDAARAAKVAAGALRGFNLEASEANRVSAALAVSTTRSGNTFQSLEIALPKVAAFADTLNFSLEDTVALLGGLQNAGFEASISGTSLRQIFAALADENSKLQKALGGNVNGFEDFIVKLREFNETLDDPRDLTKLVPVRASAALAVFANGTETIEELKDAITDVEDELDTLAFTKLDSISGRFRLLTSAYDGLILSIDKGDGALSDLVNLALTGLTTKLNTLSFVFDKNASSLDKYRAGVNALTQVVGFQTGIFSETVEKLEEEQKARQKAIEFINLQKDSIEELNKAYVKANGSLAPLTLKQTQQNNSDYDPFSLLNPPSNPVSTSGTAIPDILKTIPELTAEINILRESQKDLTGADVDAIKATSDRIAVLEQLRKNILNTNKVQKDAKNLLKGSADAIRELIKEQEDLRDGTAKTSLEYERFNDTIKDLKKDLDDLTRGFVDDSGITDIVFSAFGASELDYEAQDDLADGFFKRQEEKLKESEERKAKIIEEYEKRVAKIRKQAFDLEQRLTKENIRAKEDLILGSTIALADFRVNQINKEIEEERTKYDILLSEGNLSDEEKIAAKKKFEQQERELQKKRERRERQGFLVRQAVAIAEIAINLAKEISLINLAAQLLATTTFPPVIGVAAGLAYKATNIPIAMTTAALQTGLVLAQTVAGFEKGKDASNNYEGLAVWGEKRKEVRVDANGNIEVSPNRTTPTYVKKDDLIAPSIPKFMKEMNTPNSDFRNRVIGKLQEDTKERQSNINNIMDLNPLRGVLQKEIKRGFASISMPQAKVVIDSKFDEY